MTTVDAHPECASCQCELDLCAFCDGEGCAHAMCHGCVSLALKTRAPHGHPHGG